IYFFFQAEDGIRDRNVTGVQTCALPILSPFTGAIRYKNSIMEVFIYSDKEDFYNIMNFLRWKNSFNRMIFIASDLKSFHQLKPHLEDKQVRYLKEADILNNDKLNGKFHVLKEREFVIE